MSSTVVDQSGAGGVHLPPLTPSIAPSPKKPTNTTTTPNPFDLAFSYRHYNALYPHCNKILEQKWDQNRHDQHLKKLAVAKPNVDNKAPKVYGHLQSKLRKIQMDRGTFASVCAKDEMKRLSSTDRQSQIEKNNKMLLEKMSYIMQKSSNDAILHGQRYNVIHSRSVASRARQNAKIEEENRVSGLANANRNVKEGHTHMLPHAR